MQKSWAFEAQIEKLSILKLHILTFSREFMIETNNGDENMLFKQRLWIHLPNQVSWQGAYVGLGNGCGYITVSNARLKKSGLNLGSKVIGLIERDESEYGFPIPEELQALFDVEPLFFKHFETLNDGMKRYILYFIVQVKSSVKREERALMLMNNLLKNEGKKITFRLLLGID